MATLELEATQLRLLGNNGLSTKLDPCRNYYEWQCAWDFLWSALYRGWLDDDPEGRKAAKGILQAMAQARAEVSARERGLDVGEVVLLAPLQERLLVSLHLRAVIYTGMPDDEWRHIYVSLLDALRSVDNHYLFEDEYSYIQLCFDIRHAMEKAKRYADEGEAARIADDLMDYKRQVTYALVTKYDPFALGPGKPDGEDIDAYIWESGVIGTYVMKRASVEQASQVIAYVLGRSFDEPVEEREVADLARNLLDKLPDDLMEPEDFPSFEDDIKPLIDRQFAGFEERMPWFVKHARERAVSEGMDPDYYDYLYNVHFLTTFMSDYGMRKQNTGEIDEPLFGLVE